MKKILSILTGLVVTTAPAMSVISCTNFNDKVFSDFTDTNVQSKEMVKGVDVSSYAEVCENFLGQEGMNKDKKISYKNFNDIAFGSTTYQEYIDQNLYSYVDDNGQLVHDNMFKILAANGVNSIRLRLGVNPSSKLNSTPDDVTNVNFTYGGGHNDLSTDMYIMKQAKAAGIDDILLDIQYSDFGSDPARQGVPKAGRGFDTEQLKKEFHDYTFDTLENIYKECGFLPSKVQLGNEITSGLAGTDNKDEKFISGKHNLKASGNYLREAYKALNEIKEKYDVEIENILHIESPSGGNAKKALREYLIDDKLSEYIDTIGISYYPFGSGNFDDMFDLIRKIRSQYSKDVVVLETALPYTHTQNDSLGDLSSTNFGKDLDEYMPVGDTGGQSLMTYDFMDTLSKASPDVRAGFYGGEPGGLKVGNTGGATESGIHYAVNEDPKLLSDNKTGNSGGSVGLFDENGILLPTAGIFKDYKRILGTENSYESGGPSNYTEHSSDDFTNLNKLKTGKYYNPIASSILKKNKILISDDFKKRNINSYLYDHYDRSRTINKDLYIYEDPETKISENLITKELIKKYADIPFDEMELTFNDDMTTVNIKPKKSSIFFDSSFSANVSIHKEAFTKQGMIDSSQSPIEIDTKHAGAPQIMAEINKLAFNGDGTKISGAFYNSLKVSGGIGPGEPGEPWDANVGLNDNSLYSNNKRDPEYYLMSDPNVFYDAKDITNIAVPNGKPLANFEEIQKYKLNGKDDIRDMFLDYDGKTITTYFGIQKKVDNDTFDKYGAESWERIGLILFKVSIIIK